LPFGFPLPAPLPFAAAPVASPGPAAAPTLGELFEATTPAGAAGKSRRGNLHTRLRNLIEAAGPDRTAGILIAWVIDRHLSDNPLTSLLAQFEDCEAGARFEPPAS
jgi:hypothetical protein